MATRKLRRKIPRVALATSIACVLTLCVMTGVVQAHNGCQTHETITIGAKGFTQFDPRYTTATDGIAGWVQIPRAIDVNSRGENGYNNWDGKYTMATIRLTNLLPQNDPGYREITTGWYMGEDSSDIPDPEEQFGLHQVGAPMFFLRERLYNPYTARIMTIYHSYDPANIFEPRSRARTAGYYQVKLQRQGNLNTAQSGFWDVFINGEKWFTTSYKHPVGMMPVVGGEVFGYPCAEMWSVWRSDPARNPDPATLVYHRYDTNVWHLWPNHAQYLYSDRYGEGNHHYATCFREQTVGATATSYAHGPYDFDGGGLCVPPYSL